MPVDRYDTILTYRIDNTYVPVRSRKGRWQGKYNHSVSIICSIKCLPRKLINAMAMAMQYYILMFLLMLMQAKTISQIITYSLSYIYIYIYFFGLSIRLYFPISPIHISWRGKRKKKKRRLLFSMFRCMYVLVMYMYSTYIHKWRKIRYMMKIQYTIILYIEKTLFWKCSQWVGQIEKFYKVTDMELAHRANIHIE